MSDMTKAVVGLVICILALFLGIWQLSGQLSLRHNSVEVEATVGDKQLNMKGTYSSTKRYYISYTLDGKSHSVTYSTEKNLTKGDKIRVKVSTKNNNVVEQDSLFGVAIMLIFALLYGPVSIIRIYKIYKGEE